MTRVWRICSRRYPTFDGEGARQYEGRWHHRGTAIVYTSGSLSLATLEYFVNLDSDLAPGNLIARSADIPNEVTIERVDVENLPKNWRRYPAPEALQDLGAVWATNSGTAVLAIPSAIIPDEYNYLINPGHPAFQHIRLSKPKPFHFDPCMWK